MAEFSYRIIDADNHYYEPDDCFVRHLDPAFADRAYRIRRGDDGVGRPWFGNDPAYYMMTTPADLIGRPGVHVADKDDRYRASSASPTWSPRARSRGSSIATPGCCGWTTRASRPS